MSAVERHDYSAALALASASADVWLDATGCAAFLSLLGPDGKPNRRAFLDNVAVRGSFPQPLLLGPRRKVWRKSEVAQWAEEEHTIQKRPHRRAA